MLEWVLDERLHARFDDLRNRNIFIDGQAATITRIGPMTTIVTHGDGDRTWRNDELWSRVADARTGSGNPL